MKVERKNEFTQGDYDKIKELFEIPAEDYSQIWQSYNPNPMEDSLTQRADSAVKEWMNGQMASVLDRSTVTVDIENPVIQESFLENILIRKLVDIYLVGKMCCVDDYNKAILERCSCIEEVEIRTLDADMFSKIKQELSNKVEPFQVAEEVVDI